MKNIEDKVLWNEIFKTLKALEKNEEVIICFANENNIVSKIYDAVVSVVPKSTLTDLELYGVRSLILEAIEDKKFFDWEMPTLTGFNAEQFRGIATKLPRE